MTLFPSPMSPFPISRRFTLNKFSTNSPTIATVQELIEKLAKTMGVERGYSPVPQNRSHLVKYLPAKQSDLPPRALRDSYVEGYIPLSKDPILQDKYRTFLGSLRIGRLLEDMDYFAVIVAQKHILNPKLPPGVPLPQTLVTARIDKITFTPFARHIQEDVKISGHVNWVGKSSMEIAVWMGQKTQGTWNRITTATFFIVARDPMNTSSAIVNPVAPKDNREKKIVEAAEKRRKTRKVQEAHHISKRHPDNQEQKMLHDLYLKSQSLKRVTHMYTYHGNLPPPAGGIWMEDVMLSNTIFSQPDNRNLHNTVFGGFIMRQATELSWLLGMRFSKHRPKLRSISDIEFKKPISVNALIKMHAFVVFTYMEFIQITVYVETWQSKDDALSITNVLHFTYQVPEFVKEVYPRTYHEAMMYIDGKRHFDLVMQPVEEGEGILNDQGSLVS